MRRHPRVLVVLVVLVLLGGFGYWAARAHFLADQQREQARLAIDDGDWETAKAHLTSYLSLRPQDGEAHFLLARVYRRARVEDFAQARHHLEEARRLGWSRQEAALEGLMLTFQEHGASRDAEQPLAEHVRSPGVDDALVYEALARGCIHANRQDAANAWLNAWVERRPDDWYAHFWRGAFFEYQNKPNLAVADFQLVRGKRPQDEEVRLHLGLMLVQSGYNYEETLGYLESYHQRHPGDADARVALATCRRSLGQWESARSLLDSVIADHPHHEGAILGLAMLALDRGDDDEALTWLRRLEPLAYQSHYEENLDRLGRLQPVPDNMNVPDQLRQVFHLLAKVLRRKGCHSEAEGYERRATQLRADSNALSQVMEEQKRLPPDVDRMYRIGLLFLRLEMGEDGAYWLGRVLEERPGDRRAHEALAKYYASRKDPESQQRAREHARLAAEGR